MESKLYNVSYDVCLKLLDITDELELRRKSYIANQLNRSCTSICANISESKHAESKKDFIHKLKIASKEAEETMFWIHIIIDKKYLEVEQTILDNLLYVQKMLSKSISTTIKNQNNIKNQNT
jgi:four helix bundle protein